MVAISTDIFSRVSIGDFRRKFLDRVWPWIPREDTSLNKISAAEGLAHSLLPQDFGCRVERVGPRSTRNGITSRPHFYWSFNWASLSSQHWRGNITNSWAHFPAQLHKDLTSLTMQPQQPRWCCWHHWDDDWDLEKLVGLWFEISSIVHSPTPTTGLSET